MSNSLVLKSTVLALSWSLMACASATPRVYAAAPLMSVQAWDLGFVYEAGALAQTRDSAGKQVITSVRSGHRVRDLQLRDNIYFHLRDNYDLRLTKADQPSDGAIRLLPLDFASGGFISVDVRLEDRQGETLARIKVQNSDLDCCFLDDEAFAKYVAEQIAKLLKAKRR